MSASGVAGYCPYFSRSARRAGAPYHVRIGAKTMRILLSAFAVAPLTGPRFLPRTVVVGAAAGAGGGAAAASRPDLPSRYLWQRQ